MDRRKNLLTTSEVARRIGLCQYRVTQLANKGELPVALYTPLGRFFDSAVVNKIVKKCKTRREGLITSDPVFGHVDFEGADGAHCKVAGMIWMLAA